MKAKADCIHCYLKQVVSTLKRADIDEEEQFEMVFKIMDMIKKLDMSKTPAYNSTVVQQKVCEIIGNSDPYASVKRESNDAAMSLYPKLKARLDLSGDRLYDAIKMSVAGNVIDLGIQRSFDIEGALSQALDVGFYVDDYELFKESLENTDEVLIIGDNSGEIVFDKILIEELTALGKSVIYSVKSKPALNDATMEDAEYVGMKDLKRLRVIETGSGFLGVSLDDVSDEFSSALENSKLIISKGQANFECLEDVAWIAKKTFFLLKIKCDEVTSFAGAPLGSMVFLKK